MSLLVARHVGAEPVSACWLVSPSAHLTHVEHSLQDVVESMYLVCLQEAAES